RTTGVKNALARQVGKQPPHCGPFVMVVVRAHIGVADVLQGRVVVSLPSHRHLRRRSPTVGGFWLAWNTRPTHGTSQPARVQSVVRLAGIEPATSCSAGMRSIR